MSTTPRKYQNADGYHCSLLRLIKSEPEWAENQIRHRDQLETELAECKAYADKLADKLSTMASPAVQGVLAKMAAPPMTHVMDDMRKNLEILDRVKSERNTALAKLAESEAHAKRLQDPNESARISGSDFAQMCDDMKRIQTELAAAMQLQAELQSALQWAKEEIAAVTAERDALKAKLATINHIAMSLFVRSTSSEVTGEMAQIGRLSREDGQ